MTVLILLICRAFSYVPIPWVNADYFKNLLESNSSLNLFNMMSGNGFENISVLTLGITPFITASIIIQLLGVVIPALGDLMKSGSMDDRKKAEWITVAVGGVIAVLEGGGMAYGFGKQGMLTEFKWQYVAVITLIWCVGAVMLSIAGKLISDRYIGNGISLILMLNILSSYPSDIKSVYEQLVKGQTLAVMVLRTVLIVVFLLMMFVFVVFTHDAEKRIKVTYSGNMSGKSGKSINILPLKMCPGGVIPIIFASSIISFPVIIAEFMGVESNPVINVLNSSNWFDLSKPIYTLGIIIYALMIFGFTYFYSSITLSPYEMADNIRKHGGMIAGIRPGKSTVDYIKSQTKYLLGLGAICLIIIDSIPYVVSGLFGLPKLSFFGTSVIITVSVILETVETLKSESVFSSNSKSYLFNTSNKVKRGKGVA